MALKEFLKNRELKKTKKVTYQVVGVTFEGRQNILQKYYQEHIKTGKKRACELIFEDDNKYDSNAIAVMICGDKGFEQVGYISKEVNKELRENFRNIKEVCVGSIGIGANSKIGLSLDVYMEY